jgi:hypothetical protein
VIRAPEIKGRSRNCRKGYTPSKSAILASIVEGFDLALEAVASTHWCWPDVYTRGVAPLLIDLREKGLSARQIAAELTAQNVSTAKGGKWHAQTVLRLLRRVL